MVRDLVTGEISTEVADAVVLASGGYGNVFFLSTNAKGCNVTATWRAHRKGAYFANPCYTQIHPTCIPESGSHQSKLTLMSESLRNDGRVWVPKKAGDHREAADIPEDERDYYLERIYPAFGNLVPRDIASRAAKNVCDEGRGVGPGGLGVYLDFADAITRLGQPAVEAKYGNLFEMYARITGEDPYVTPMRIYGRALHDGRALGRLRPAVQHPRPVRDRRGELLRPRREPARRVRADAGPGGRLLRAAEHARQLPGVRAVPEGRREPPVSVEARAQVEERLQKFLSINGDRTVDSFHRELGHIMWEYCGMERTEEGLTKAIGLIQALREEFWTRVKVPGVGAELNQNLERAGRVADFFELAELMCVDALHRAESCGGHFRGESQTEDGEALRHDDEFSYVAAWEFAGTGAAPTLHKEDLNFEYVHPTQRSYK